jgi:hypothetical protein
MFTIPDEMALDGDYDRSRRALATIVSTRIRRQLPTVALMACIGKIGGDIAVDQRARAWRRCRRYWPIMMAEGSFKIELVKMLAHHTRAGAALMAIDDLPGQSVRLIAEAERSIRVLERMKDEFPEALARNLRACLSIHRGERARASALFDTSAVWFEAKGIRSFAAATRRCQGMLLGGEEGRRMVAAAEGWFRTQRFASMAHATSAHVVGLPRAFLRESADHQGHGGSV